MPVLSSTGKFHCFCSNLNRGPCCHPCNTGPEQGQLLIAWWDLTTRWKESRTSPRRGTEGLAAPWPFEEDQKSRDLEGRSRKMPFESQHRLSLLTNRELSPGASKWLPHLEWQSRDKNPGPWTPGPVFCQFSLLPSPTPATKRMSGSALLSMQARLTFMLPESSTFCGNRGKTVVEK